MSKLQFISVVLNDGELTYNSENEHEILCEVFTEDGDKVLAFIEAEQIEEIEGVVLPEKMKSNVKDMSYFDLSDSNQEMLDYTAHQDIDDDLAVQSEGIVWSTFRPTLKDNEATEKFIHIVTSKLFENRLRDKKSPKFKVWQQIYNEMRKLGFLIADNEKDGGKKCDEKWRNLESKYMEFNDNAHKTGQSSKKKPPFYDIMHAIKYKHKISPPSLLDTLSSNTAHNVIPQNNISKTQEPQANLSRSETIVTTQADKNEPSTSAADLNNIFTNPKTILKPKNKISPSDILNHMTIQHKEILEMQTKHFEEIKNNMEAQNDQRKQMIGLLAKLVDSVSKKKKRRSKSVSDSD